MNTNKNTGACQTIPLFSVYVMWCHKTNMTYVGVTGQDVWARIRQHNKGKQFVDKQIKAIGWEGNWDYWIVEEGVPSELISEREQFWIAFFECVYPKGYNKTCGGISKITVSEDTCKKLRKRARERDLRGKKNPNYGKKHTEEVKAAQSARMKGKNNPMYGKPPKNKGVPHTAEQIAKMSAAESGKNNPFYGKHHTEKTKAILREKALARHAAKRAAKEAAEKAAAENAAKDSK